MATHRFDVMIPDKRGEQTYWRKIGSVLEKDGGKLSMKLDMIPLGAWDGWAQLFVPKPKDGAAPVRHAPAPAPAPKQAEAFEDDDIPF